MKLTSLLAACLMLGLAALAPGQPADAQRGRTCAPTSAEKTTVAAVAKSPKDWIGKCVTVSATYSSERLYSSIDAVYGHGPSIGGFVDGQGSVFGFYDGEFTGRVADCATAENDLQTGLLRSPGISLHDRTLGCLQPKGPFLVFMSQGELTPSPWRRKMWRDVGNDYGDIQRAVPNWQHLEVVERIANDVHRALQTGNRALLNSLIKNEYKTEQLMTAPATETAIAKLRDPAERTLQVWTHGASTDTSFKSEACFCLTRSCAALWPIARRDADNQFTRPYACIRVDAVKTDGWKYTVDASMDYDGLREP